MAGSVRLTAGLLAVALNALPAIGTSVGWGNSGDVWQTQYSDASGSSRLLLSANGRARWIFGADTHALSYTTSADEIRLYGCCGSIVLRRLARDRLTGPMGLMFFKQSVMGELRL